MPPPVKNFTPPSEVLANAKIRRLLATLADEQVHYNWENKYEMLRRSKNYNKKKSKSRMRAYKMLEALLVENDINLPAEFLQMKAAREL